MRISDWSSDVCSSDLRRFRSSSPANGTGNPHGSGSPHLGIRARCVESASSLFARHEREDGADRMRAAPAGSWRLHHLQMQRTLRLGFGFNFFLATWRLRTEIGRANVCTPVTNAQL